MSLACRETIFYRLKCWTLLRYLLYLCKIPIGDQHLETRHELKKLFPTMKLLPPEPLAFAWLLIIFFKEIVSNHFACIFTVKLTATKFEQYVFRVAESISGVSLIPPPQVQGNFNFN